MIFLPYTIDCGGNEKFELLKHNVVTEIGCHKLDNLSGATDPWIDPFLFNLDNK